MEINPGITTRESDFETCFRKENVKLAPGGFFGISAATGALAGQFILLLSGFVSLYFTDVLHLTCLPAAALTIFIMHNHIPQVTTLYLTAN